jgi:hypothetical protein
MNPAAAEKTIKLATMTVNFFLLKDLENRFFMVSIAMKNASFSLRSDYIEYLAGCQLKHFSLILLRFLGGRGKTYFLLCKKIKRKERETYRHGYPMMKRRRVELLRIGLNRDKLPHKSTKSLSG